MTSAEAFEAGRRAYEAAARSTGASVPTAEPQRAPVTMRTQHDEAGPVMKSAIDTVASDSGEPK